MAQLQAMMATTARDLTHDLNQQQQTEEKLQQVAMHKLQQRHQQEMQQQKVEHDIDIRKLYTNMQALQQQVDSLGTTNSISTHLPTAETPRTQRQNKVAQKTRSRSQTTNETQNYQSNTSVVTTKYANPTTHDALWQPSVDGVIQSHRGAPATLSRNRFDNLYITGDTDHDNDTIRWEPTLYIRNELLEYQ